MTAKSIIDAVAEKYSMKPSALCHGGGNQFDRVKARAEAMALVRREMGFSFAQIGRAFGGFHHTSVIHLVKRAGTVEWNPQCALTRDQLTKELAHLRQRVDELEIIVNSKITA